MRYLIKLLTFIILIFIVGCSSNEEVFVPMEKISDQGKILSIGDFKSTGFKKSNEYNVDELPGAISAYYGFMKNEFGDPEDYELRFYSNHIDAVNLGIKYADNIVGEDACISKDCSMWLENLNQRTHLEGGRNNTWNGTKAAKYDSYVIYNNLILFCSGYDELDSMKNCTIFIDKLNDLDTN
tara:strand:+ start:1179 stop:1724 length:546 start_codon:yes stop_codon:yes gene_type:complete